jgi:flavin-dependent dehydrogenase
MGFDAVVVGASLAGCTTALQLGRAGLRVAVVERQRSMGAHKGLCGHFVLGGTKPTLERLGLWQAMLDRGAATSRPRVWTGDGWVDPDVDRLDPAISLRRRVLDPFLRQLVADTPGVELLLGHRVTGLLTEGRRVTGVRATSDAGEQALPARLVVGADGHTSPVARLAGVEADAAPNGRFLYWSYYRDLPAGEEPKLWLVGADVAVIVPTDDGLWLVGVFGAKAGLEPFADRRHEAIERYLSDLPESPSLHPEQRVGKVVGTSDYPFARRDPVPRPGLVLVGDAATTSDPVPAVGCGWAFRSAEWLTDAVIPALHGRRDLGRAARAYRRSHRFVDRYDRLARRDALTLDVPRPARLIREAATHDSDVARRLGLFAMRAAPPSVVMNPRTLARAWRTVRAARRAPSAVGDVRATATT